MKLERLNLFGDQFALSWAVCAGDVIHVAGMVGMEVDFSAPRITDVTFPDGRRLFAGSSGTGAPLDGRDATEPE